jgi:hypothetical protein
VSRRERGASRFWSLQTRLNNDSEICCAAEPDPLVDVGLTVFDVDDGVEYPPGDDNPFPDDLPDPEAMRGSTWVDGEKRRAQCVHARIADPGSLLLHVPGKETGVPVWKPPTRVAVHCISFTVTVDTVAAARREVNDTYWRPATASLLARSKLSPVRLVADLVDSEPLGGRAVELVAAVSCTDLSHNKRTCVCGHYRKRRKKKKKETCHAKGTTLEKLGLAENAKSEKKTHVFPSTGISPVKFHHRAAWVGGYVHGGQPGVQTAIQEGLSMLFEGPIWDWIGLSEGIAFRWRR